MKKEFEVQGAVVVTWEVMDVSVMKQAAVWGRERNQKLIISSHFLCNQLPLKCHQTVSSGLSPSCKKRYERERVEVPELVSNNVSRQARPAVARYACLPV